MNERQLIENLEWTVKEDRASLDGTTVEDVRKLFTAWTKTEEAVAERQAAIDCNVLSSPRYIFCVHVDAEALDECLGFDGLPEATQSRFWSPRRDPALGRAPYVNIVEKVVEVSGTPQHDDDDDDDDEEEEEEEEEDSEEEEEVISVKAHWLCVIPDIYTDLNQTSDAFQLLARDVDRDGVSAS